MASGGSNVLQMDGDWPSPLSHMKFARPSGQGREREGPHRPFFCEREAAFAKTASRIALSCFRAAATLPSTSDNALNAVNRAQKTCRASRGSAVRTEQRTAYAMPCKRSTTDHKLGRAWQPADVSCNLRRARLLAVVVSRAVSRGAVCRVGGWPRIGRVWGRCLRGWAHVLNRGLSSAKTSDRDVSLLNLPCRRTWGNSTV